MYLNGRLSQAKGGTTWLVRNTIRPLHRQTKQVSDSNADSTNHTNHRSIRWKPSTGRLLPIFLKAECFAQRVQSQTTPRRDHAHFFHTRTALHRPKPSLDLRQDAALSQVDEGDEAGLPAVAQTNRSTTTHRRREELKSLVDVYEPFVDVLVDPEKKAPSTYTSTLRPAADQPRVTKWRMPREPLPADDRTKKIIDELECLLDDSLASHEEVFRIYQEIPVPRVAYLVNTTVRRLVRHLRRVEFKDERSMLRYFTLMDDMTVANVPLTLGDWNTAVAFAGRWVRKVGEEQVETAMQMWIRMEREAGLTADSVTFNILFDIASKAGKFALAEVILKEIQARDLEMTRFLRTGKIFFCGSKKDGEGVRRSYKELVDAGEIVDTAVLNCVIVSMIKAGEASAAEQVFERMKRMHQESTGARPAPRNWRGQRDLANLLVVASRTYRNRPEARGSVQESTPVSPNLHTYRLLVRYHAIESGNIDRITELFAEMQSAGLPLHGTVLFHVFTGFQVHGGVRYSAWTRTRLDQLWRLFLRQVEMYKEVNENLTDTISHDERGSFFHTGMVIAILLAYAKCARKDMVLERWDQIQALWKPNPDQSAAVNERLASVAIIPQNDNY